MSEISYSISVVIVNYNVRFFLEQALRSVFKASSNLSVQVWVVDNSSSDDSIEMVKQKFPTVQIIENIHNVGFARANNQAIKRSNATYVLLLNPDTLLEELSLKKCFHFMEHNPDAGALGASYTAARQARWRDYRQQAISDAGAFGCCRCAARYPLCRHGRWAGVFPRPDPRRSPGYGY
jgi:GT2 family glycosyltransferase